MAFGLWPVALVATAVALMEFRMKMNLFQIAIGLMSSDEKTHDRADRAFEKWGDRTFGAPTSSGTTYKHKKTSSGEWVGEVKCACGTKSWVHPDSDGPTCSNCGESLP